MEQPEPIEISIIRLEERLIAQTNNIENILAEIKMFSVNSETDHLQMNTMIQKLEYNQEKTDEIEKDLKSYKENMKPYETLLCWKRIPLYTLCLMITVSSWEQFLILFQFILKKFGLL